MVFVTDDVLYFNGMMTVDLYRLEIGTEKIDKVWDGTKESINPTTLLLSKSRRLLYVGGHNGEVKVFEIPAADLPNSASGSKGPN
jgi:hypothetical protein